MSDRWLVTSQICSLQAVLAPHCVQLVMESMLPPTLAVWVAALDYTKKLAALQAAGLIVLGEVLG